MSLTNKEQILALIKNSPSFLSKTEEERLGFVNLIQTAEEEDLANILNNLKKEQQTDDALKENIRKEVIANFEIEAEEIYKEAKKTIAKEAENNDLDSDQSAAENLLKNL